MKRLTIHDIKYRVQDTSPYFFSRDTLRFFGQRMKDFRVYKQADGRYMIRALHGPGKPRGETIRFFNPTTNELDRN